MKILIKIFTIAVFFIAFNGMVNAQDPPPPPPGGGQGGNGNVPGGGAPIAGGLGILLTLGVAYGMKKVYQFNKNKNE